MVIDGKSTSECVISGKVEIMRELLRLLKDKGDGKAGLGFNDTSLITMDSPEDGVFRIRGRPGRGTAPYIRVVVVGMDLAKGEYPTFNPSWLWRYIKTGNIEDSFSLVISSREKANISFSSAGGDGFDVPLGMSQPFDLKGISGHAVLSEDFGFKIPCLRYEISIPSFRISLDRAAIIHPKYFAFYSIDGRLYIYVRAKGADYFEPVGTVNCRTLVKGVEDNNYAMFDSCMPVSAEYFRTILERFDSIEVSLPKRPDKITMFTVDASTFFGKTGEMEITFVSGMNMEFRDLPTIEQMRERIETGGFAEGEEKKIEDEEQQEESVEEKEG